jgi:8-oxo-dGTP diphosphatase
MEDKAIKQKKKLDLLQITEQLSRSIQLLSVDCVVFGFHDKELKVLLSKYPELDLWSLQGGFIQQAEDVDAAARRVLEERTGVKGIYLEQFHLFGKANRPTLEFLKLMFFNTPYDIDAYPLLKQRIVTVGYYSLVDFHKVVPNIGLFYERSEWFPIDKLPNLAFDHPEIIQKALATLRQSLNYNLVGFNLMPESFTMNELQNLYETILGEKLWQHNFQRKILELNILERLEKKFSGGAHKAPYLYRFKDRNPS